MLIENKVIRGAIAFGSAFLIVVPAIAPIHKVAAAPLPSVPLAEFGQAEFGVATWYGEKFHGLQTASGEMFDMFRMTAAHRRIPLGSMVRVTNIKNGRSVVVRINDRGPVTESAMLDLSFAAAQKLGIVEAGRAKVRLDQLVEIAMASSKSPSRN
jgi:rare lipoprotein A